MTATPNDELNSTIPKDDISDQDMIQFIVENINKVLQRSYSLVEFDEQPPVRLLQTLSDLFGSLSTAAAVDFNQTAQENGAAVLFEFLTKTLGYKPPQMMENRFVPGFIAGEKTILYPVFFWVLRRMPENHKRVYLARYLSRIDIPEDLRMSDEGIRDTYAHYENLRQDFIATHKRVEALKEANADPAEARRKLSLLESERDRLNSYISAAQKKLSTVPNKDGLLSACKALRAEQEENQKLNEKKEEQKQALLSSQKRLQEQANRHRDIQRDMAEMNVMTIIQRMRDEISTNRMKLESQLPQEMNEKRQQTASLQRLLNEPADLNAMHQEMGQIDKEIQRLTKQVEERTKPGEDGSSIVMMKQQLQNVVKKKNSLLGELNALQGENQRLLEELREKQQQLDERRNSKMLKGEDFKKYANQVRSKTAATKNMKARLADLRGEFGVLEYTERLLRSKHEELLQDVEKLETRFGAKGYVSTAEHLSKVSEEKNVVEQVKGQTLEELSRVVQEFVQTIRERRNKLAPQILELRNARAEAQGIEQDYEEKKATFDYQESLLMQEVNKLDSEVSNLAEETKVNESLYHRLNAQMGVLNSQMQRAADEKEFQRGQRTLSAQYKTHAEQFQSVTQQVEMRSKELQRKRRDIEDNHENNLQQVDAFMALRKLLECKAKTLRAGDNGNRASAIQGPSLDSEMAAFMAQQQGQQQGKQAGYDMLVLSNQ